MTKGEKMRLKLRDIMCVCCVESRCDVLSDQFLYHLDLIMYGYHWMYGYHAMDGLGEKK